MKVIEKLILERVRLRRRETEQLCWGLLGDLKKPTYDEVVDRLYRNLYPSGHSEVQSNSKGGEMIYFFAAPALVTLLTILVLVHRILQVQFSEPVKNVVLTRNDAVKHLLAKGATAGACIVLAFSLSTFSAAQEVKHAPTVEQCQADQKLWLSTLESNLDSNVSRATLSAWGTEMEECKIVNRSRSLVSVYGVGSPYYGMSSLCTF